MPVRKRGNHQVQVPEAHVDGQNQREEPIQEEIEIELDPVESSNQKVESNDNQQDANEIKNDENE